MSSTIEKMGENALLQVGNDLSSMIGAEVRVQLKSGGLVRFGDFFDQLGPDMVVVKLEFDGDIDGIGAFALPLANAIRLAGKLLMLPVHELNQNVADGKFDNEYRYAAGEVVKCIVGSFVRSLPDTPYQCAEIRCGRQKRIGRDLSRNLKNEYPAEQACYFAAIGTMLAAHPQDDMYLVLPAIMAVGGCEKSKPEKRDDAAKTRTPEPDHNPMVDIGKALSSANFKNFVNGWMAELDTELSGSFDVGVKIQGEAARSVTEPEIRYHAGDKPLLFAPYRINGSVAGRVVVCGTVAEAMRIGSVFGSAADQDSDTPRSSERFDSNLQDGYHELITIILSLFTELLGESAREVFHLQREQAEIVINDTEPLLAERLLEDRSYVVVSIQLERASVHYGAMNFLFPSLFVEQVDLIIQDFFAPAEQTTTGAEPSAWSFEQGSRQDQVVREHSLDDGILLINLADQVCASLSRVCDEEGLRYSRIDGAGARLQDRLTGTERGYRCVLLALGKPDEMALAYVIKIGALTSLPLVVAAPQWTQSQVVKALRYGASDIIVTPVDGRELREKLQKI